jgi:uncharacterized protein (TIGR01777 family)
MQTVLITGGSGFVGRNLSSFLIKSGYRVIILSRSLEGKKSTDQVSYAVWDLKKHYIDPAAINAADHIIHLAGAGVVDKKWTDAYKQEILESRTGGSKLIIEALQTQPHHIKSIISASAIGWYGPDKTPVIPFTETDPASDDFLGQTCRLWEQSIGAAESLGVRVCTLRTGIVLGNGGGAMDEFIKPIKFGIAGILGSGKQAVSWIHINDLCRMYLYAMENQPLKGSYNAVAPTPVSNKELTLTLAHTLRGKFFIPMHVPAFVLKLMMGQRSIEVLKSATVSARKIQEAGFVFNFPNISSAVNNLLIKKPTSQS